MSLTKQEFDYIRNWAKQRSAISLEDDKEYLVTSRLVPVLRRNGMTSMSELVRELSANRPHSKFEDEVVDAMTTNETFFFRDTHPFELMRSKLIPALMQMNKEEKVLRIWSAACSSGQEIYSIAILIREHFPQLANWNLHLYATDLSQSIVEKARNGIYSDMEVKRGLSEELRERYFKKTPEGRWQIANSIRSMVDFRVMNFLDAWPDVGKHDLVLIRNVLIYFEIEDKRRILERVRGRLATDGMMLLGTSETTLNIDPYWEPMRDETRSAYFVPKKGN